MSIGLGRGAMAAVLGLFLLLLCLSESARPIYFRSLITTPSAVIDTIADTQNGYFYLLFNSSIIKYSSTTLQQVQELDTSNTPYVLDTALGFMSGKLRILNDGVDNWLFLCGGKAIGIANLTEPTLSLTNIWSGLGARETLSSCSVSVQNLLWVGTVSSGSTASFYALAQPSNWKSEWEAQSQTLSFGEPLVRDFDVLSDGAGYAVTRSLSASGVFQFDLVPTPSSVSTAAFLPIGSTFPITVLSDDVSSSFYILNLISLTKLQAGTSDVSLTAVFEGVGTTVSIAMDNRPGKRVLWGTFCNNATYMTQRYSMDTDSVQLTATHSSKYVNPPVPCVGDESSSALARGAVDFNRNLVITNPAPQQVILASMYNCSASTTCTECQSDNMYCSWCVAPTGSSCVATSTCDAQTGAGAFSISNCPVLTLATPAAASAEGSTSIVLTGANFASIANQTSSQGGPYCKLGSSVSKATIISDSLLRCNINPTSTNGTLRLGLSLSNGVSLDSASLAYSIYKCSSSESCASCATRDQPDCAWCASDQVCSSRLDPDGVCPTVNSLLVTYGSSAVRCGTLSSMTPDSIPVHFPGQPLIPQTISISASYPNATTGWQCSFGFSGGVMQQGTLDFAAQTLTCPIAPLTEPLSVGLQERTVAVSVYFKGKLFATNTLDLTYYNCSRPTSCGDCSLPSRPFCSWCLSSIQCIPSIQGASCSDVAGVCPSASVTPLSTDGSAPVSLTVSGGPFVATGTFSCRFESASMTTTNAAATRVSATQLTCNAPASAVSDPFDAKVSILLNGQLYTVAGDLRYYTCSPATNNCSNCADPLHIGCSWCSEETRCDLTSSMTNCTSAISGACPTIIDIEPSFGSIAGNLPVVLTGSNLASAGSYECSFTNPSTPALYISASAHSATSVSCNTPVATLAGEYAASVRYTDPLATQSDLVSVATFHYVDCAAQSRCDQCLATTQCIWCTWAGSCKTTGSTCDVTTGVRRTNVTDLAKCPTITSVSPLSFQVGTVTPITVTGKNLVTSVTQNNLVCQLDAVNFVQAQRLSQIGDPVDVLECLTRPSQQPGTNPFRFRWTQSSAEYAKYLDSNGQPYQVTGFDCLTSTTCDQCASNPIPYCGWCSADGSCTTQGTCSNNATWAQKNCPRITSMSYHQVDQSTIGNSIHISVSSLNLANGGALDCKFATPTASTTSPASYLGADSVSCRMAEIPGTSLTAFANVQLVHADTAKPFTSNIGDAIYDPSSNLEYVNCISPNRTMDTCPTCLDLSPPVGGLVDSRCGWCVYSGSCALATSCSNGIPIASYQNASSDCARIIDIDPKEGPSTGNTQITITGSGLIQDARLQCMFGTQFSPTVFMNPTKVSCVTPSRDDLKSGSVASDIKLVLFKASSKRNTLATEYTVFASSSSGLTFTYNYAEAEKKSNLAWIAAPVIVAILLVVIAILVFVLLRRRSKARKLTPPDFNTYAFSANTRLLREVPQEIRAKLDQLVPLLSENSYLLPLAIRNVTHGSDDDLLSRALIYGSYPNSFALDMLVHFIQTEVTESEVEGELFRASSLACKMYTVYSKVVGVQYLWRTLARSIHTLNDAGSAEDKRHEAGSKQATPPSTGQVSMIDLGTLEVDPERLAERLEKDVDQSVMTDVTIYQYELLLKTGRIFKRVMDSVNSVPRELRIVAKRVKSFVGPKFNEREMDYKGVCAFFFLRFICPAVMTPQIYGVLEQAPGETAQRYFVLISKTIQNLANGTLPSQKEAYMAKMDEFVVENKDTLHRFIDTLCNVQEHAADVQLDDEEEHNSRDIRLQVQDDLYYSSLSFIHSHYMAHSIEIQEGFRSTHDEEFGDRVDSVMRSIGGGDEPGEKSSKKKSSKKAKKHAAVASSSNA